MPKRSCTAAEIVAALAAAAERWCDADFPPRVRATAAVCERLGYTIPVVEFALDRLFGGLTVPALCAAIVHELGSLEALDGAVSIAGRPAAWARGVDRVTIVSSDATIGVAIPPLAYALCAKCVVTVKDRSDALVAAFVETLGEERSELAAAVDARSWTGGDDPDEGRALGAADVVVAFGGPEALLAIRGACAPDATFIPFGHRASAGYYRSDDAAGTDIDALAAGAARDALLYDGDGCLSLHLIFVEGSAATLEAFAGALTAACSAAAVEFPPGTRGARRATTAAHYTERAAFRAANGAGRVVRDSRGAWSIVVDAAHDEPPPFGAGVIPLVRVANLDEAAAYLQRHNVRLQAVATATPATAGALAERLGAVRATAFGRLQDPPLAGHHGGRARIADFVRWIDLA
jgi:hypothetical protein